MIPTRCIIAFHFIALIRCSFVFQPLQLPIIQESFNNFIAAADGQKLAKRVEEIMEQADVLTPSAGASFQQARFRNEHRNDAPASVDGAEASRQILMRAGHLFDSVSSREDLEEDSGIQAALKNAMVASTAQVPLPSNLYTRARPTIL